MEAVVETDEDRKHSAISGYCDGLEAGPRSVRRSAVAESEMTGEAESHKLTEWQGVDWIY